jgi:hypothetical protein
MSKLDDAFNIAPEEPKEVIQGEIITTSGEVIVPQDVEVEKNVDYDYEKTRGNLHSLLAQGQEALMHALEVAKQSEHPRAFEVVGGLMKQLADINHQLLDLSEKRQKLTGKTKDAEPSKQVTNNNAFFVGSTTELNKMIQNMTGGK